ncbi:MAG: apolipoprotein N-acyltransferase [Candidatus Nitrotoga sp.]
MLRFKKLVIALSAGVLVVPAFSPAGFSLLEFFPLSIIVLSILFWLWHTVDKREAAWLGFYFGLGLFGAGIGWIYIALHDYGGMSPLLAFLATTLFTTFWSLFPVLAGYIQAQLSAPLWIRLTLIMPAAWVLLEWLRGMTFTGFPWLAMGYTQVSVTHSPLTAYAPVLGVYGVSLMMAISAGLLVLLLLTRWTRLGKFALAGLGIVWIGGATLQAVEWTQATGEPVQVALLQGNIPQHLKFREETLVNTLETYRRLVLQSEARLIVLPETAVPMLRHNMPENYLEILRRHAQKNGGDILIGGFEKSNVQYFNSVFSLGMAESQSYRKNHLVLFGEFIPLRSALGWLINGVLNIPMSDLTRGGDNQPVLHVAGQRVAVNICYEDVFGEEIIRALPEATLLVNVTNDAWYGKSSAAMQHNQIARMRALESGRMMLRATNTGVTSIIRRDGTIQALLPQHEEGALVGQVQGYTGSTPYVRWGNAAVLLLIAAMLAYAWLRRSD